MPRSCPGGGGGWAQVELTDALIRFLRLAVFLTRSDTSLFNRVVNSSTYLCLQYARVVILRTPPYSSVRVASCLILNLVGN